MQLTKENIKAIVTDLEDPTLTIVAICEKHQVSRSFIYTLKKQLIKENLIDTSKTKRRFSYKEIVQTLKEEGADTTALETTTTQPE